ncbi:MAG: hypothetical protein WCY19_02165 [Candidatus Gastranaerophilaceae bacterium]
MSLSEKKQQITDQVGNMQQSMAQGKNMLSIMSSNDMRQNQQAIMSKYYDSETGKPKEGVDQMALWNEYSQAQYDNNLKTYACNSVFESQNQSDMKQLNNIDTQITLQSSSIESQLKQLSAELEGVEKAEDKAAQQEAPKFGLT